MKNWRHGCKRLGFVAGEPFFTTWFVVNETCTICNRIDGTSTTLINVFHSLYKYRVRNDDKRNCTGTTSTYTGRSGSVEAVKEGARNERVKNGAKNNGNAVSLRPRAVRREKGKISKRRKNDARAECGRAVINMRLYPMEKRGLLSITMAGRRDVLWLILMNRGKIKNAMNQ